MSFNMHLIGLSRNASILFKQPSVYGNTLNQYALATYIQLRYRSRTSPFPKEDGVTRLEKLAEKFNPPPSIKSQENRDIPADQGITTDSTGQIFSSYVPPEKKKFFLTPLGVKQRWEGFKGFLWTTYAVAIIKRHIKPFKIVDFAKLAQDKLINVNNALQEDTKSAEMMMKDHATLIVIKALRTQFLQPSKKVYWKFINQIERPKVVHARVGSVLEKDNIYAQVTVRMKTKQILAIRDRYNRTIKGHITEPKDVIDYVVFERHLKDPYGRWRICGKVFQST